MDSLGKQIAEPQVTTGVRAVCAAAWMQATYPHQPHGDAYRIVGQQNVPWRLGCFGHWLPCACVRLWLGERKSLAKDVVQRHWRVLFAGILV